MPDINITGADGGRYNVVNFYNLSSVSISTFNSSLCSVQGTSPSQGTILFYKPADLFPSLTNFVPGSGYVIQAKNTFAITVSSNPPSTEGLLGITGADGGRYNIVTFQAASALSISTFNSSLCSVQGTSPSQGTILFYKPTDLFPSLTNFVPGSGYVIQAKGNFNIEQVLNGFVLESDEYSYLIFEDDTNMLLET